MKAIVAEGLTKFYHNALAVDHVSFEVNEGEIFGFLGPNGAGKTTTIKMLNTLTSISEGKAFINGFDVSKNKNDVRRCIGLVPQDLTLDREMNGMEVLKIQAQLYDVPSNVAKTRIAELLKLVGLEEAARRQIDTYSGGMQKRLELAMGLVNAPKVLFLDEPTVGLDAQSRALIWDYIKRLSKDFHVTVFLTTHYLEEADELCSNVAIINGGKISAKGSPAQLKESLGAEIITLQIGSGNDDSTINAILSPLPGVVKVSIEGSVCRISTVKADQILPNVIIALASSGVEIKSANVTKASLNQVFIKQMGSGMGSVDEEDELKLQARDKILRQQQV